MNSQFESGRHRAQKCSNIVVSEDCAPCWHETYNAMRTSKVIGPQPDEVDQMSVHRYPEDLRKAHVCAKKSGVFT